MLFTRHLQRAAAEKHGLHGLQPAKQRKLDAAAAKVSKAKETASEAKTLVLAILAAHKPPIKIPSEAWRGLGHAAELIDAFISEEEDKNKGWRKRKRQAAEVAVAQEEGGGLASLALTCVADVEALLRKALIQSARRAALLKVCGEAAFADAATACPSLFSAFVHARDGEVEKAMAEQQEHARPSKAKAAVRGRASRGWASSGESEGDGADESGSEEVLPRSVPRSQRVKRGEAAAPSAAAATAAAAAAGAVPAPKTVARQSGRTAAAAAGEPAAAEPPAAEPAPEAAPDPGVDAEMAVADEEADEAAAAELASAATACVRAMIDCRRSKAIAHAELVGALSLKALDSGCPALMDAAVYEKTEAFQTFVQSIDAPPSKRQKVSPAAVAVEGICAVVTARTAELDTALDAAWQSMLADQAALPSPLSASAICKLLGCGDAASAPPWRTMQINDTFYYKSYVSRGEVREEPKGIGMATKPKPTPPKELATVEVIAQRMASHARLKLGLALVKERVQALDELLTDGIWPHVRYASDEYFLLAPYRETMDEFRRRVSHGKLSVSNVVRLFRSARSDPHCVASVVGAALHAASWGASTHESKDVGERVSNMSLFDEVGKVRPASFTYTALGRGMQRKVQHLLALDRSREVYLRYALFGTVPATADVDDHFQDPDAATPVDKSAAAIAKLIVPAEKRHLAAEFAIHNAAAKAKEPPAPGSQAPGPRDSRAAFPLLLAELLARFAQDEKGSLDATLPAVLLSTAETVISLAPPELRPGEGGGQLISLALSLGDGASPNWPRLLAILPGKGEPADVDVLASSLAAQLRLPAGHRVSLKDRSDRPLSGAALERAANTQGWAYAYGRLTIIKPADAATEEEAVLHLASSSFLHCVRVTAEDGRSELVPVVTTGGLPSGEPDDPVTGEALADRASTETAVIERFIVRNSLRKVVGSA
jgi:hypothetical protein